MTDLKPNSTHSSIFDQKQTRLKPTATSNIRRCPSCDLSTLSGMPGGRDAVCKNCGHKDPCCYD